MSQQNQTEKRCCCAAALSGPQLSRDSAGGRSVALAGETSKLKLSKMRKRSKLMKKFRAVNCSFLLAKLYICEVKCLNTNLDLCL